MSKIEGDIEVIVKVAELYYEMGQTQQEIADKLKYSRPMISKLLSNAHDLGIVKISVKNPNSEAKELAMQMEEIFSTDDRHFRAIVVPSSVQDELTKNRVYKAGAKYLEENIFDNEIIGIGRGSSVYGLVNNLSGNKHTGIETVPLAGGLGSIDSLYQVNETARKAAYSLGGICHYVYSPVYLGYKATKDAILSDPELKHTFDLWDELDWAVVGIGAIFQSNNNYYRDLVLKAEVETNQKVVADLCINLIDPFGKPVSSQATVVAINLSQLRKAKKVMAIASGTYKVQAILACIKGNWIDTLVTDEHTALSLIENYKK
ncbi:sugar-binding transcriptional regulator [Brassicibacter mesophilus]|uniref:sugar-binding transcriptional regulator n=1 Tax=Brassicibacter mesophilus TaxID=745119 RepID=UPI003D222919